MLDRDCGEHSVHDERPGRLPIAHEFAQDNPSAARPARRWPAAGWASHDEIAAAASDVDSGRSNTRGVVAILRNAQSVSHAKRTRSGPESTSRSQARLFSCCAALG